MDNVEKHFETDIYIYIYIYIKFPKKLKKLTCTIILLSITILLLTGSCSFSTMSFVLCEDKPYFLIIWLIYTQLFLQVIFCVGYYNLVISEKH